MCVCLCVGEMVVEYIFIHSFILIGGDAFEEGRFCGCAACNILSPTETHWREQAVEVCPVIAVCVCIYVCIGNLKSNRSAQAQCFMWFFFSNIANDFPNFVWVLRRKRMFVGREMAHRRAATMLTQEEIISCFVWLLFLPYMAWYDFSFDRKISMVWPKDEDHWNDDEGWRMFCCFSAAVQRALRGQIVYGKGKNKRKKSQWKIMKSVF